jgi:hypothetical protein
LSLWRFLGLREAFLRVCSNLSNFLLNWANNCFDGLGFLPAFLAARKSTFTIPSFLYLQQSLVGCVVCVMSCSSEKLSHQITDELSRGYTYAQFSLKRSLKRTHIHGSHPFFLQVVLIPPLVRTHPENVTCQISLGEQNICRYHTKLVAWAVVTAGQLCNVGVELLYALYKLMYPNPLGLLEHAGKVLLFLLSCVVWKHS